MGQVLQFSLHFFPFCICDEDMGDVLEVIFYAECVPELSKSVFDVRGWLIRFVWKLNMGTEKQQFF